MVIITTFLQKYELLTLHLDVIFDVMYYGIVVKLGISK